MLWDFSWELDAEDRHTFTGSLVSGSHYQNQWEEKRWQNLPVRGTGVVQVSTSSAAETSRHFQTAFMSREHTTKNYSLRKKANKLLHVFGVLILFELRTSVNLKQSGENPRAGPPRNFFRKKMWINTIHHRLTPLPKGHRI